MSNQHDDKNVLEPITRLNQVGSESDSPAMKSQPEMFADDRAACLAERYRLQALQDQGITPDSWCPGGSVSGGICAPSSNTRNRWMELYDGARKLPIGECVLLGSHNSGFDKKAPQTPSNETCQDTHIREQLAWGVRVLDLRIQFYSGYSDRRRFSIFHGGNNGRNVETDVLDQLLSFRAGFNAHKEIVILDFHQFKNFTAAAHEELRELIMRKLGSSLVPHECAEAAIEQLWELNMNTVVAYNHEENRRSPFWPGVNQRWSGSNTPGKDRLASFISEVGSEAKAYGALRSVQAAYYSLPMFVPKDLSEDLMNWFRATDDGGPIAGHYIITVDWCLRQRLCDNVIFANGVRKRERGLYILRQSPNGYSGSLVNANASNIYVMKDGDWSESLRLGPNTNSYTSIVLVMSDAEYQSEIHWNGGSKVIKKGTRLLVRIEPNGAAVLVWEGGA